ncbi:Suppressor of Sensor Kinase (SLN1) [Scheffersomyces spartinae]|uniref:MAP kinase kinase kinase n=1 Tax=Scheffersomyces spartinae TaxID=45513 RepID=A0A9P7V6D6_9ASCO|nr:Suppressor of Sensor Kinase (SLN1) [Scheffersomyces spartinae]KAG7192030.1 Suppressor of Sensor Kinase (SLN1) [Scheffersomyces spartinae]
MSRLNSSKNITDGKEIADAGKPFNKNNSSGHIKPSSINISTTTNNISSTNSASSNVIGGAGTGAGAGAGAGTGSAGSARTRPKPVPHFNSHSAVYQAQEKQYLKKLKSSVTDDYYTRGIKVAEDDMRDLEIPEDEDDEDDLAEGNTELLAEIDDDKYQIDLSLALSMIKVGKSTLTINPNQNIPEISKESTDPAVLERLEWQSMLNAVLTGDVVKSEKTKLINNNSDSLDSILPTSYKENLWFGIKAKLMGRDEDDQKKITLYRRTLTDLLFEDIIKYEINYDDPKNNPPQEQVIQILAKYETACELWPTLDAMKKDKPICATKEFEERINALNAWLSISAAIEVETNSLKVWLGGEDMEIYDSSTTLETPSPTINRKPSNPKSIYSDNEYSHNMFNEVSRSFAERVLKEKDVTTIFEKRLFLPLMPWIVKSKQTYILWGPLLENIKLPDFIQALIELCVVPMKLIKEIIAVRMSYAVKLHNPTLMMIDQMIEDFRAYIAIAVDIKMAMMEYIKQDEKKIWFVSDLLDDELKEFDNVVLEAVIYYLSLINKKLLDSSRSTNFRTFKEPDELENTWNFLKQLGKYFENGNRVVAERITLLTSKLIHRVLTYYKKLMLHPLATNLTDLIRWYSSTSENFGQLRRKLARFTSELSRGFTNSLVFNLPSAPGNFVKTLLESLKYSNHFLVYTNTIESQGVYFFASGELKDNEAEILRIINGSYIGIDFEEPSERYTILPELMGMRETADLFNKGTEYSYVLAICPPKPIVWDGNVVTVKMDHLVSITDVKPSQMLLISRVPFNHLDMIKQRFLESVSEAVEFGGILKPSEQRCSLAKIHTELTKINRTFFKMSVAVLDSVQVVRNKCKEICPDGGTQDLINNHFVYARDYGKNSVRNLDSSRKSTVIMKLIQLSIEWVSFVCDECIPTDKKTFKACVLALEFSMDMTRGFNVLVLSDEQFGHLKSKVARCMSLLISHFDIMGARFSEAEKKRLLKWTSQRQSIENAMDDEAIVKEYEEEVMKNIGIIEQYRTDLEANFRSIGKVIDGTDLEYQFVTLLASSFSSVSIRWQKGRFIGGGTFGHVYSAVNLDTGGVMAVKEIRFHDSQSIKNIVPSIKDEMTVLEMLNHPNVVQYFGVEVHRDKVYIFMEFCEGGSLAGLLTHGRIEDEMVIQIYTLQMLEGLAYLHQSGVVHRDIKPENILLDHTGIIKFVDFGAAKVIANSGCTRASTNMTTQSRQAGNLNSMTGTPMYMSPEVITGASADRNGVVDIWSLGCCVLEMATGRRPWANLDNEWAIMYHIAAGNKPQLPSPEQLSEPGRKFVSRCLEHDPKKRPSAVELLSDPWMVTIRQIAFATDSTTGSVTPSDSLSDYFQ